MEWKRNFLGCGENDGPGLFKIEIRDTKWEPIRRRLELHVWLTFGSTFDKIYVTKPKHFGPNLLLVIFDISGESPLLFPESPQQPQQQRSFGVFKVVLVMYLIFIMVDLVLIKVRCHPHSNQNKSFTITLTFINSKGFESTETSFCQPNSTSSKNCMPVYYCAPNFIFI